MSTNAENPKMDVYRGVRWSAISGWGEHGIQFCVTIVLARLLLPHDYGLLAMATVFIGFLDVFSTMGFGKAVVQRREINNSLLSSLFYINLAIGGLLTIAGLAAAPLCAWIYRDPRVPPIMAALSLNFLLMAPAIVPQALLIRRMAFDRIACVQLSTKIIGGGLAIALAATGWGVWSLILPGLLFSLPLRTVLFFILSGWRPRMIFHWSEVRSVLSFGANLTGFAVFNYFARNADNFIIGAFLGARQLGFYSLAYGILLKPRDMVAHVLSRVLLPTLSRMQDDDARLKAAYLRACGAIAFVAFPMMLGLVAVAHLFVEVVLGEKWLPAVPLIYVFAPLGMIQPVWSTAGQLFLVKGRADWQFRWGVVSGSLIMCSFVIGLPWGVLGVAVSYTLTCLMLAVPGFWIPFRLVSGLKLRDLASTLLPYSVCSGIMALVVVGAQLAAKQAGVVDSVNLMLSVVLGVIVYVILVFLVRPPALSDLRKLLPNSWQAAVRRISAGQAS